MIAEVLGRMDSDEFRKESKKTLGETQGDGVIEVGHLPETLENASASKHQPGLRRAQRIGQGPEKGMERTKTGKELISGLTTIEKTTHGGKGSEEI
jgi:hypothetical protein